MGFFVGGPKVYDYLLKYDCVRDWVEGYESHFTRDQFLRTFHLFVQHSGRSPDQLLSLKPSEAKRVMVTLARNIRDRGKSAWALAVTKSVKSFYRHHGVELKLRRSERIRAGRKRIDIEIIPTKEQIYRMADSAGNLRDRAIILCLWQSGVRVGCLVRWNYELVADQLFQKTGASMRLPVHLRITENVDTKLRSFDMGYYYTFLGREAAEALRDYLRWRMKQGKKLLRETPIFVSHATTVRGKRLRTGSVRSVIKRCAKDAGLDSKGVWTHCLRKAFRKVLNNSNIDDDTREALMGHRLPGSRGSYFDSHDTEEIAQKYARCNFSRLGATLREEAKKEMLLTMWREQAKMFGIDPMKVKIEKEKKLGKGLSLDEELKLLTIEIKKLTNPQHNTNGKPYKSRIITENELVPYMEDGWNIIKELSNKRFLIKKPNHTTMVESGCT